jgi:hypothetical protein
MSSTFDDYLAITNMLARYSELLNLGDLDGLGELFRHGRITATGTTNTWEGSEAITAMYRDSIVLPSKLPDSLHFTSNLQIQIDGERATGKAYFVAMHQSPSGIMPILAGRYHDTFRKVEGRWWFDHRHMIADLEGDLSTHLARPLDEFLTERKDAPCTTGQGS